MARRYSDAARPFFWSNSPSTQEHRKLNAAHDVGVREDVKEIVGTVRVDLTEDQRHRRSETLAGSIIPEALLLSTPIVPAVRSLEAYPSNDFALKFLPFCNISQVGPKTMCAAF